MIASLTSLLTFIGIDGMGHVNGHNVDRSTLHQGKIFSSFSFLYIYIFFIFIFPFFIFISLIRRKSDIQEQFLLSFQYLPDFFLYYYFLVEKVDAMSQRKWFIDKKSIIVILFLMCFTRNELIDTDQNCNGTL